MKVLVLEDEPDIRDMLRVALERSGLAVTAVGFLAEARTALRHRDFDIVVLDLTLPDGSGLEILQEIRRSGSLAHVIVLSGAFAEADRVHAFTLGADDYVLKPFSLQEFAARVLAARRRLDPAEDARLVIGPLEIDLAARRVSLRGRAIATTSKEFDLLAFLAARPGVTFSREDLLRSVWESAPDWQQSSTVTEHVRRLRVKIEDDPRAPTLVVTVRGSGYRLDLPEPTAPDREVRTGAVVHVDGRIVSADADALILLGGTEPGVVGAHLFDFVAPASRAAAELRMQLTGSGGALRSELMEIRRVDGSTFSAEVSSSATEWAGVRGGRVRVTPVLDSATRLRQQVIGIATDVSDAVVVTDVHSHVRSWNAAAARLYGWAEHEVLGRHVLDVLQVSEEDDPSDEQWAALAADGRWHGVLRHRTRDGSTVEVLATTNLIRNDLGDPLGVVSVGRLVRSREQDDAPPSELVADIGRGIADDEFEVYYQPVVRVADAKITSFEALVRWNHPTRGLLAPADFLAAAETSGLIRVLGAYVLERACSQTLAWRAQGYELQVSVNVSACELADVALPARVAAVLEHSGLEPSALWLEVTETGLVEDVATARHILEGLSSLGVGIALDDFGTGWASLTYLQEFPVHALKVDRSFIGELTDSARSVAIARSVLALGDELDLFVVAEGVETATQQDIVGSLGFSLVQGYLYGAPTPAAEAPLHRARRTADLRHAAPTSGSGRSSTGTPHPGGRRHIVAPDLAAGVSVIARHERPRSVDVYTERTSDAVETMLKALLRVRSSDEAVALLHRTVRMLGGTLVPAEGDPVDVLPLDVSFGRGPTLLVAVEPFSVARMQLERMLPGLAEDTRNMVEVLRARERPAAD